MNYYEYRPYCEGILSGIFKSRAISKREKLKDLEMSTVREVEDIKKLLPRAQEDFTLIVADLAELTNILKTKDPSWNGSFLRATKITKKTKDSEKEETSDSEDKSEDTPDVETKDKNSKKTKIKPESVKEQVLAPVFLPSSGSLHDWYFSEAQQKTGEDEGKLDSILVKMMMPKNIWYSYFFSELKNINKITDNLKKGNVGNSIDDYFPINQRTKLNYHALLFKDLKTIRKRGEDLLNNVEKLIEFHDGLDENRYRQTRKVAFAWTFRAFESYPRFESIVLRLISRYS